MALRIIGTGEFCEALVRTVEDGWVRQAVHEIAFGGDPATKKVEVEARRSRQNTVVFEMSNGDIFEAVITKKA